jgi:hypothetical protein
MTSGREKPPSHPIRSKAAILKSFQEADAGWILSQLTDLRYVANQLKANHSLDLHIINEVVAGIESVE